MLSIKNVAPTWQAAVPYFSLLKVRIVFLLLVVAGTSAIIAERGLPPGSRLGMLLLAGGLASAGASVLNHYLDRDIDALMTRTRHRPLPAGKIRHPGRVVILGVGLVMAALLFSLLLNPWVTLYILLGALFYVLVYTWWLKRRTQLSVVLGGAGGGFAALAGWAVVEPQLSPLAFLIAFMVFLWTPIHFWNFALVNKEDYRKARVPMMPVLDEERARWYILGAAFGLFICSLLPWLLGYLGGLYLVFVLALSLLLGGNLGLVWERRLAWRNYKLSGLYLAGIMVAMVIDTLLEAPLTI